MERSKKYTGVYKNKLSNGDTAYHITYKDGNKKKWLKIGLHSQGVREAFCSKYRGDLLLKLRLGENAPITLKNKTKITLHEVTVDFFEKKAYKHQTYRTTWGRYVNHIKPYFEDRDIQSIQYEDAEKLHNTKKNDPALSDKSVQLIMESLGAIINYAISVGKYQGENPIKKVKVKKVDNARTRFLSLEEVELLISKVKENKNAYLFTLLSLSTGARLSDVYNMKKKQFNLDNRTVTIKNSKGNSTYQAFLTKRVLPLIKLDTLDANDILYDVSERVIQRFMQRTLNELFNVGLDSKDAKNRVVIHTLRHTFASQLAIAGTPIFTIQKLLDHKNIEDTLRYAKLSPENGREFVERLF